MLDSEKVGESGYFGYIFTGDGYKKTLSSKMLKLKIASINGKQLGEN